MKAKTDRLEMWIGYFILATVAYGMIFNVTEYIHRQGARGDLGVPKALGPYSALLILGLAVVLCSRRMLRDTGALRRKVILSIITAGVMLSIILNARGGSDRYMAFAVYSVPQALLVFAGSDSGKASGGGPRSRT